MTNSLYKILTIANIFENKLRKYSRIDIDSLKPLEKFITSESNPKFFFTMTEIPKIGINFQTKYDTPLGVYAYPLTKEYYNNLITNTLPFAGNNPYINLFTLKVSTFNLANYTDSDFKRDINTLKLMYNITDDFINKCIKTSYSPDNKTSNIWNITRILAGNPKKWNTIFRNLGYTHFYDPNSGIIHKNEPTQIVILDPSIIVPIESYHNPRAKTINKTPFTIKNLEKIPYDKYELFYKKYPEVFDYVIISNNISNEIIDNIIKLFVNNKDKYHIYNLMHEPDISGKFLHRLFLYALNPLKSFIIENIATHKNTSANTLDMIVDHNYGANTEIILKNVASNFNTHLNTFKKLLDCKFTSVLEIIAGNKKIDEYIIDKLSNSNEPSILIQLIHNKNAPKHIFYKLFNERIDYILEELAYSKYTPDDIFEAIFNMHDETLNNILSHNDYVPTNIIEKLKLIKHKDKDPNHIELEEFEF